MHLLRILHGASHTVESLRHSFPVFSHFHHGARIKDPVAKEVIKLQANPIPPPLMDLIVKLIPFGGEHSQMLHVSPGQTQAGFRRQKDSRAWQGGSAQGKRERERDTMTKIEHRPHVGFWNIYEPASKGRISTHHLEPLYI